MPVDLNEESSWKKALPAAALHLGDPGGVLHAMTVLPDFGESVVASFFPADYGQRSEATARAALKAVCAQILKPEVAVVTAVRTGTIYREIMQYADEIGCDLIVMASHRPELSDFLLGPNAARVVRHARQSVLVVRE